MKKNSCIIVDDEALARELLTAYIQKIPQLEILATCSNAIDAKAAIDQHKPDILFLDIQMPNLTGLELLRMLKKKPAVIFTTAYSEHAIEGYELDVIDYLLKPIEFDRFFQAVSKAVDWINRGEINAHTSSGISVSKSQDNYFFVKADHKIVKVDFAELLFIEALQKYVCIYTTAGRIVTLMSMSQLEESLPPEKFIRVHRSYIVSINKIESIEGNMIHIGKQTVPISKGQRDAFLEVIKKKGMGI